MESTEYIGQYHDQAMALADAAFQAQRKGDVAEAKRLFGEALPYARRAAEAVAPDLQAEPTRSVLLRSAGSLALAAGDMREAERLLTMGLTGSPPDEIAEELRDLLETVYQTLHPARKANEQTAIRRDQLSAI